MNFLAKRRIKSSCSSDGTNETKKLRHRESKTTEVSEEEGEDAIIQALDMASDVGKDIKKILEKVSGIETSVKKIESSIAKLEKKTKKLEESQSTTKRDIETLKGRLDNMEKKLSDSPAIPAVKLKLDEQLAQMESLKKKQDE